MPTDPRSDAEARYDEAREQLKRRHPALFGADSNADGTDFIRAADALRASAPRQETPSPEAQGGITSEVDATGAAYYALASLEPAERRAALRWLTERTLADLRSVAAPPPEESKP